MKKPSRSQSPARFVVPAMIFIMAMLSICAVWNTSSFDLVWIWGAFVLASVVTYLIIAPKLLPIGDSVKERAGAYGAFRRFLFGGEPSIALVRDGQVIAQSRSSPSNAEINAGMIITDSTSVVTVRTATGISRVAGAHLDEEGRFHSGVIFTTFEEEIDSIIDLRPQVRRKQTTAQTRDGITVDVAVIAFFAPRFTRARKMNELYRLQHRGHPQVHYPPPFIWRRASILQVLNTRRIERTGEQTQQTEWYDRIMEIAIPRLRELISEYTVDELTAWTTTDKFSKHPRYVIRDKLRDIVTQELEADDELHRPTGIDVRFMSVSSPIPPEEVVQRRIQAWGEEWHRKEADIFSQADAEAILTHELARAQAQGEMTARINDILQEAKEAETASSDLVMLRFLEAMEKMSNDPTTRALLTFDALRMLKQLREMFTLDQSGM